MSIESPSIESDPRDTMAISSVESWEDLDYVLDRMGKIQGKKKEYPAEDLKKQILDMRDFVENIRKAGGSVDTMNARVLGDLTNSQGLRDRVRYLLKKEEGLS